MNKPLKTLSITFFISGLMVLAATARAYSLDFSFERFVSNTDDKLVVGSSLKITGAGNIYAIDGFNNTLQVFNPITPFFPLSSNEPFNELENLSSNQAENVYLVDGINNSLQVFNPNNIFSDSGSNSNNNGIFRWVKFLSIDKAGNLFRSSQITSRGTNNVYLVDGINNQLQALTVNNGNFYLVDGINNSLQVLNPSRHASSLSDNPNQDFRWIKTLKIDQTGNIEQSNEIDFPNANNNVNFVDGINEQVQTTLNPTEVNNDENTYLVDGINNSLQVFPENLDLIDFFQSLNNESAYDWNWTFNSQSEQESNFFGNPSFTNNGQANFYDDFTSSLFNHWFERLNLGEVANILPSKNINFNNAKNVYFIDGINNELKGFETSKINNEGNFYSINGINSSLQILPSNPNVEVTSIPEPSSTLGVALAVLGGIAYRIRKH